MRLLLISASVCRQEVYCDWWNLLSTSRSSGSSSRNCLNELREAGNGVMSTFQQQLCVVYVTTSTTVVGVGLNSDHDSSC